MLVLVTARVDGVERALSRYRRCAAEAKILRNLPKATLDDTATVGREAKDRRQAKGLPLIILKTPAWPREDWAEPQRRRVRKGM